MMPMIGLAASICVVTFGVVHLQRRQTRHLTELFTSIASTLGFTVRRITPKPTAANVDVAARHVPILSAFARLANKVSHPGMFGERDGVGVVLSVSRGANSKRYRQLQGKGGKDCNAAEERQDQQQPGTHRVILTSWRRTPRG
jgi:hypothetical protein